MPDTNAGSDAKTIAGPISLSALNHIATSEGWHSGTFNLCGPEGQRACHWLDVYMGFFMMDGLNRFLMVRDCGNEVWAEDVTLFRDPPQ